MTSIGWDNLVLGTGMTGDTFAHGLARYARDEAERAAQASSNTLATQGRAPALRTFADAVQTRHPSDQLLRAVQSCQPGRDFAPGPNQSKLLAFAGIGLGKPQLTPDLLLAELVAWAVVDLKDRLAAELKEAQGAAAVERRRLEAEFAPRDELEAARAELEAARAELAAREAELAAERETVAFFRRANLPEGREAAGRPADGSRPAAPRKRATAKAA